MGATRGILRSLLSLVRDDGVSHVGVAFDHVIESFRNQLFDGYKTGDGVPEDLMSQFPLAERAAHALGVVTWPMIEFIRLITSIGPTAQPTRTPVAANAFEMPSTKIV